MTCSRQTGSTCYPVLARNLAPKGSSPSCTVVLAHVAECGENLARAMRLLESHPHLAGIRTMCRNDTWPCSLPCR